MPAYTSVLHEHAEETLFYITPVLALCILICLFPWNQLPPELFADAVTFAHAVAFIWSS